MATIPKRPRNGRSGDPSENVKDLNEASHIRQDDLRVANEKLFQVHVDYLKEIGALRAAHASEIRQMETERLDSIRQVDVLARNTAADRAADAIQALAATTAANAENLRTALINTAATMAKQSTDAALAVAKQVADQFEAIVTRVAAIEASQYRGEGREKFADPERDRLQAIVNRLEEESRRGQGKSAGLDKIWGVVAVVITIVLSLTGIYIASNKSSPQTVYAPGPGVPPVINAPATVVAPPGH